MSLIEWTVASNPAAPTLTAVISRDKWNMTTETMREEANLTVVENSLLIFICLAGYPVLWYDDKNQPMPDQRRTYNPFLEGNTTQYGFNSKIYPSNKNFSIHPIDEYESRIVFRNLSTSGHSRYKCKSINASLEIKLNLYVRKIHITPHTPQLLQAGFSSVCPSITWSSRYFVREMVINSFVYTVPPGMKVDQFVMNPEGVPSYAFTGNATFHSLLVAATRISRLVWRTTVSLTTGTFYDNGDYRFVIRLKNQTVIDHPFNFDCDARSENAKDVIRVNRADTMTVLTANKYYEMRVYLLFLNTTNVRLRLQEQLPRDNAGCGVNYVNPAMANEKCGLLGVSLFNESHLETGIRIFMKAVSPCIFTVDVDLSPSIRFYPLLIGQNVLEKAGSVTHFQLHTAVVDTEILVNTEGRFISEPSKIIDQHVPAYINESLIFRCVVPACSMSKVSLEKNGQISWPPISRKSYGRFDRTVYGHPVTVSKYVPVKGFHSHTIVYDWTLQNLTLDDTGDYACVLFMPSSAPSKRSIKYPDPAFHLQVLTPGPPKFEDGLDDLVQQVSLKRGSKTVLSCNVRGSPKPNVDWLMAHFTNDTVPRVIDPEKTTLEIYDTGIYVCNVTNKFGNNSRTFEVVYEREMDLRLAISIPVVIVVLMVSMFTFWCVKRKSLDASFKELAELLKNPQYEIPIDDTAPLNDQVKHLPYNRKYEIDRDYFTLTTTTLGNGQFGSVFKGELKKADHSRVVAVKIPGDLSNLQLHQILIDELKVMSHIRPHVNVLELVGACTSEIGKRQLFVLTEYCENGSLSDYLSKNYMKFEGFALNKVGQFVGTPGSIETLLKYCYQAANGMEHLAAEKIIHRDLALRNLLLTANHIVKIADFGMSRHDTNVYRKQISPNVPVPIFWMALESLLFGQYTQKSDVWSFGIVLWEIFSCARRPYPDHSPDAEFRLWLSENENNRLDVPKIACHEIYQLMRECWKKNPVERPTFSQCKRFISQTLEHREPLIYQSLLSSLSDAWRKISNPSDDMNEANMAMQSEKTNDTSLDSIQHSGSPGHRVYSPSDSDVTEVDSEIKTIRNSHDSFSNTLVSGYGQNECESSRAVYVSPLSKLSTSSSSGISSTKSDSSPWDGQESNTGSVENSKGYTAGSSFL